MGMKQMMLAMLAACVLPGMTRAQEVRRAIPVSEAGAAGANDLARFLAGRPASSLGAWQSDAAYQAHAREIGKLWDRYNQNYFSRMRLWSAVELSARVVTTRPVFYFFGGPDAVSPLALFPDAPVYIMGGLEPVGSITAPQTMTPEAINEGLSNLRKSTEVILSFGHFITKDMKAELDRTGFRGVLPVMSAFLAMAGAEIVSTSYVGVGGEGALQEYGSTYGGGRGMLPGLKIVFRRTPGAGEQTIYYIQANVVDDALKSNGALLRWAGSFGTGNVYLKAASYLMHEPSFSRIREFLLSHADAVLQDDSGIPYRFFQNGSWQCWLFGTYTGTLDIFAKYYQNDLQAAFASRGAQALPFGTGYKWRLGESNLMLAVRVRPSGQ